MSAHDPVFMEISNYQPPLRWLSPPQCDFLSFLSLSKSMVPLVTFSIAPLRDYPAIPFTPAVLAMYLIHRLHVTGCDGTPSHIKPL
jgi:hypothetical protein